MVPTKFSIKTLGEYTPPLTSPLTTGGRIVTPAGELAQVVNGDVIKFLAYVEFKENIDAPRGNHYHELKEEMLYIIKGRVRAIYKDIDTNETDDVVLKTGDLACVKPRCAHVFFPLEYTQAVEFSATTYDPTDTHKYQIDAAVAARA